MSPSKFSRTRTLVLPKMVLFSLFLTIFCPSFLLFHVSAGQNLTTHSCEMYTKWPSINVCLLRNLNLTTDQKHFQLIPGHPVSKINGFRVISSRMEVVTREICETLPFLTYFEATEVGIASIEPDAFEKCPKLMKVDLGENPLWQIPPGLFDSNKDLIEVAFWSNKLSNIDENLFRNNPDLTRVFLSQNRLSTLPSKLFENNPKLYLLHLDNNKFRHLSFLTEFPTLPNLTELRLDWNKLSDLEPLTLLSKFPNLTTIELDKNQFLCERQAEIEQIFKGNNVTNVKFGTCIETMEVWGSFSCGKTQISDVSKGERSVRA